DVGIRAFHVTGVQTCALPFYTLGIVPAASYSADYGRNPIGSGPYKLVAWNEGEQLIVERNKDYYGEIGPFEKITFLFTGSDAGRSEERRVGKESRYGCTKGTK